MTVSFREAARRHLADAPTPSVVAAHADAAGRAARMFDAALLDGLE